MAKILWGKVYYKDIFAGILSEESGGGFIFTYDQAYLNQDFGSIAYTLPVQEKVHRSIHGLHPFFDNLVSEGWLEQAQSRLLGKRQASRFELLLAFGFDCAGAVSLQDPEPTALTDCLLDHESSKEMAVLSSRASLSGVQSKMAVVKEKQTYRLAKMGELSTHIAKFPSSSHSDLIENEYLTTKAFAALLPKEPVVAMDINSIEGIDGQALLIERFDRKDGLRLHFEEFNQLLARASSDKYEGAYADMAGFIKQNNVCLSGENYRLYVRILAGLLLGNTDMHLKNFAMMHQDGGLRLAPAYDQVASSVYAYKTLALELAGASNRRLGDLKAEHLVLLGLEYHLSLDAIESVVLELEHHLDAARAAILDAPFGSVKLKEGLVKRMERQWRGTFALIGKALSKRR